ncbi:hypothetical protein [Mesorhizobium sp. 1B3]|uniref:hypothetical protein n=1 Tax=Mesorhizobium sp. 1B3 TaxID=3243599 RepID=UPI003D975143
MIAFFAWRRFRLRTFDPSSFDYRVLREFDATQLRGTGPMRRAYAYYAGALIVAYVAFTLFGGLIFNVAKVIPMAGLQVDVSDDVLNSAQWPLIIAFGLAGFTPLIRPMELFETWLRQRAHKWVGIPVKIKDRTRVLLRNLERVVSSEADEAQKKLPAWVVVHIEETDSVARVMVARKQLELLLKLSRDEDRWPSVKVREEMRRLESEEIAEAEMALQNFDEILEAMAHAPGIQSEPDDTKSRKHQRRLEENLKKAIERIDTLRNELCSIFTIYADKDLIYSNIHNGEIRSAVQKSFPAPRVAIRPDHWIPVLLIPIFVLYLVSVSAGLQSLMGPVRKVAVTVLATSVAETLRIAIIFWLPLLAVFLWREYRRSEKSWRLIHLSDLSMGVVKEALVAMLIAFGVGLVGLVLLALIWSWVIADNPARYRELLFSGNAPALIYFPAQAGASALCAIVTLFAADFAENTRARLRHLIPFGLVSACFVLLWMAVHTIYFGGLYGCSIGGDLFTARGCIRVYNLTDFLVYLLVSYMAAGVFTCIPREAHNRRASKQEAARTATVVSKALIGMALLVFGIAFASAAIAGEDSPSCRRPNNNVIVAGFREDAEPFSYLLKYGEKKQYKGYIAQLCYKIFEGSKYTIVPVPVSAGDRFRRLRTACAGEKEIPNRNVDILCDPITMEFSPERNGIYSPIVFVSGVSYILRRSQVPGKGAFLAYVRNTTAKRVVELACKIDLFDVRRNSEGIEACKAEERICDQARANSDDKYVICVFEDHSQLIKWFCDGNSGGGRQVAYFGDRELIIGKLDSWTEKKDCSTTNIERQQLYYTYEPYALLVTKADPELVQFVQRRVFEIFSHRSEALSLFATYFPKAQMSQPLANLFLLNAVSEERFFRFSSDDEIDSGLMAHRSGRSSQ